MYRTRCQTAIVLCVSFAICVSFVVLLVGVSLFRAHLNSPIETTRDSGPRFRIDPNQPYEIRFWEGGAPRGGNLYTIWHDGRVSMSRLAKSETGWGHREETTFTLPPEVMATLLELVESTGVMELHVSYKRKNTFGGFHSSLLITQGGRMKSVSCRNHFPEEFTRFVDQLDSLLEKHSQGATWMPTKDEP